MREVENFEGALGVGLGVAAFGMMGIAQSVGSAIGETIAQTIRNRQAYARGRAWYEAMAARRDADERKAAELDGVLLRVKLARYNRSLVQHQSDA